MSNHEKLFSASALDVAIPTASTEFPPAQDDVDAWVDDLKQERQQVFFDEQLRAFLLVRVQDVKDGSTPPESLLEFLAHLQVALEASYISSVPALQPDVGPKTSLLSAPPRGSLHGRVKALQHPAIVLPNTPNPTPEATESDKRYVHSEGTLLLASIWGQKEDSGDAFALRWSEREGVWIAIYQLTLTVAFLRLHIADPLLCLTMSATLRDTSIALDSTTHPLAVYIESVGGIGKESVPSPTGATDPAQEVHGLEEVNLLGTLSADPRLANLSLTSARLGPATRHSLFSLAPISHPAASPTSVSPTTSRAPANTSTLRKSFRKTLATASGFRVRMRTTFVPYLFLPSSDEQDVLDVQERTVVLCVEIENHGEGGRGSGFAVESVHVKISGSGSQTSLIGLGDGAVGAEAEQKAFPLKLAPLAQVNLLYAVEFLKNPEEDITLNTGKRTSVLSMAELRRAVVIDIRGRPFVRVGDEIQYPARTFSSRWNCLLDLSPQQPALPPGEEDGELTLRVPNALPEPPSPFPQMSPRHNGMLTAVSPPPAPPVVAGKKRHTLPGGVIPSPLRKSSLAVDFRKVQTPPPVIPRPFSVTKPSNAMPVPHTPTTYAPPPPIDVPSYPQTPAYPNFPQTPAVEYFEAPINSAQVGHAGPTVEIRRARGMGLTSPASPIPPTPGPIVGFGDRDRDSMSGQQRMSLLSRPDTPVSEDEEERDEGLVVSVGLVQPGAKVGVLERFTVDVFVFNRSARTRRLEVSHPKSKGRQRGLVAMDNRVRIGPLRPMTCQSVRMEFIGLEPGVHSLTMLTLKDVETEHAINLRNVLDVVVHEPVDVV